VKHIQRIDEFISTPYNWDWDSVSDSSWVATFKTEDDKFWVEISKEGPFEPYELKFSSERRDFNKADFKGPLGAMKILTTVFLEVMVSFLDSNPGAEVKFYGSQGAHDKTVKASPYEFDPVDNNQAETKRDRVYKMLMNQLPDNLKWEQVGRCIYVSVRRHRIEESDGKIWFHGTNSKFDEFDQNKEGIGPSKMGVWFTDDKDFAGMFGSRIIGARLEIKNPKRLTMDQWDDIRLEHAKDTSYFSSWKERLVAKGYDSIFVEERETTFGSHKVKDPNLVAVFDVGQIKQELLEKLSDLAKGFNLDHYFNYLNTELFDGELEPIPLVWKHIRGSGGHLQSTRTTRKENGRTTVTEKPLHIAISDFYEKTEQQLMDTLAHEMLHLWILQRRIQDDSYHGRAFRQKMAEINDKGIVNITLKDEVADVALTDKKPLSKPVIAFVQEDHTLKRKLLSLLSKEAFTAEAKDSIMDAIVATSKYSKRDFTVRFFECEDAELRKFPVTRKFVSAHKLKYVLCPDGLKPIGKEDVIEVRGGEVK